MRLSLRFIIPLFLALGALAYAVVPLVDKLTLQWFERDLDLRASLIASTVQEPLRDLIRAGNRGRLLEFFSRISQDERLYALGFCPLGHGEAIATPALPAEIHCAQLEQYSGPSGQLLQSPDGALLALSRDLEADHRSRDEDQLAWTPETLRAILRTDLPGHEVMVVSNREPYIHVREGDSIALWRPASGLVTAMEPIMRACSGTWIAHGGGSADREVVDEHARVAVPPEQPAYQLRRVWLTPEQEAGYYYGFANEGLWPLCHIAHARPQFRSDDFAHYQAVNRRFADTIIDEAQGEDPIILVQDYHFALAPQMIRERLPRATIITFWHIPWPNCERFGICPWRDEIIGGLLGSSILGFHTQLHCNNFIEAVDRFVEARIDREQNAVVRGGR